MDLPVKFSADELWSDFHALSAFVCACLPVYKPLWNSLSIVTGQFISRSVSSLRSMYGTKDSFNSDSRRNTADTYIRMNVLDRSRGSRDAKTKDQESFSSIVSLGEKKDREYGLELSQQGIVYSREVEVV